MLPILIRLCLSEMLELTVRGVHSPDPGWQAFYLQEQNGWGGVGGGGAAGMGFSDLVPSPMSSSNVSSPNPLPHDALAVVRGV